MNSQSQNSSFQSIFAKFRYETAILIAGKGIGPEALATSSLEARKLAPFMAVRWCGAIAFVCLGGLLGRAIVLTD